MSLSAYAISGRVWVVTTDLAADPAPPTILPIGSVVLTQDEAMRLGAQLYAAAIRAEPRASHSPPKVAE